MQEKQEKQLFTEITNEESATVNGGSCYYWPQSRRSNYYGYRRTRRYNQTVNVYFNNYDYPKYY
ncbi:MAG: hypothetical protein F6K47_27920 [Symploca sp. SIO2E6]|nr:hypothetical protein [Symploca sp. SIO2E6]